MTMNENAYCWWKQGIIYHIYPQSYKDTNHDGTGDIRGIIRQLDYLVTLGVEAIWLSPIYDSPFVDGGYDVRDYYTINPVYGTMEDFTRLLAAAHERGIKVVMDMVFNHTSRQHPWFVEASSSKRNPRRHWYIWHPGKHKRKPNNWITNFGQSAWTWHERTGEYYYHSFFSDQPDLNWRNPEVKKAMFDVLLFWLNLGVDGFRFDVINMLFIHPLLKNCNLFHQLFSNRNALNRNQPEVYELIKEIRSLLNKFPDKVSIGEIYTPPPGNSALANSFLGNGSDMLHLAFDFSIMFARFTARQYYRLISKYYTSLPPSAWPCFVLSNHDMGRNIKPRFSVGWNDCKAKVLAGLLLTLKGTPFIYYGDEIGMENTDIPRSELKDRYGKLFYPFYKGRDRARTPMQWNDSVYAGFSTVKPWLPLHPNYTTVNVEAEETSSTSLLNFYKSLIAIRKKSDALLYGDIRFINQGEADVLIYERTYQNQRIVVLLNFGSRLKTIPCPVSHCELNRVYSNMGNRSHTYDLMKDHIKMRPFEVLILEQKG